MRRWMFKIYRIRPGGDMHLFFLTLGSNSYPQNTHSSVAPLALTTACCAGAIPPHARIYCSGVRNAGSKAFSGRNPGSTPGRYVPPGVRDEQKKQRRWWGLIILRRRWRR